jgi:hypothetical protein
MEARSRGRIDPARAFGDPDGSLTDIDDVMHGFVGFDDYPLFGGLAVSDAEVGTRVLVGGKGAGKSRYLRRFAADMKQEPGVYVDERIRYADSVQKDAPSTLSVIKVSHSVGDAVLTERWQFIWRRAIFRALVSHILNIEFLREHLSDEEHEELTTYYTGLFRHFRHPLSIYSQVGEIINDQTRSSLGGYLEKAEWNDLEALLAKIVRKLPPLYFYIDAIDDEYAHAPLYWLRCQKGLFYTVMKLAKDEFFGGRLHIVICVRDHVLSSVLRSEHANRYRDSPNIRSLVWGERALRVFLTEKLSALPDELFIDPSSRDDEPVAAWLGFTDLWNEERSISEGIGTYILRHTRLSPRDIVQCGNRLTERIVLARTHGEPWSERIVRDTVGQLASEWGDEQLTICAQQISADMMPAHAADHDYAEVFTGALAYVPVISQGLRSLLVEAIGEDRFDQETFAYAREVAAERFDERTDVFSVLWQNGLLGYERGASDASRESFYSIKEHSDSFLVPDDCDSYVLHSCLIDALGIRPVGSIPVLGFRSG